MAKGDSGGTGGMSSGVNSGSQTESNFNKFMPNMGGAHYGGGSGSGTMSGMMGQMMGQQKPQMQPATQNQYQPNNPYMGSAPGGISQGGGMMPQMGQQGQMMQPHVMRDPNPYGGQVGNQIGRPIMESFMDPNRYKGGLQFGQQQADTNGINNAYQMLLGRAPDAGAYQSWMGNNNYMNEIANSPEGQAYKQQQQAQMPQMGQGPDIQYLMQMLNSGGMRHTMGQNPYGPQ